MKLEFARSSQNGDNKRSLFECGCYHNLWAAGIYVAVTVWSQP